MDAQKMTHIRIRPGLFDPDLRDDPPEFDPPEAVFVERLETDVDTGASLRDVSHRNCTETEQQACGS